MQAFEITGKVDEKGQLILDEPLAIKSASRVKVILLVADETPNAKPKSKFSDPSAIQKQLEEMAQDADIQREIQAINQEFEVTEMDGLANQ